MKGNPKIDRNARKAGVALHEATTNKGLRNLDLDTIEFLREKCGMFLARSEKYLRVRQDQSIKSQLNKRTG